MSNDVIERLKSYCLRHPELMEKGIIKGMNSSDCKVVLEKDGKNISVTIDDLENDNFDFDKFELKNEESVIESDNVELSEPEEIIEELEDSEVLETDIETDKVPTTLKEMNDCVSTKKETLIDKALVTFAIDEKTGNINMNKAIKIVTDNSVSAVVNSVRDNTILSTNLSDYDIKGVPVVSFAKSEEKVDIDKMIDDSFNNIMVYVEIAKLKNIIYNVDQIENAKNKYSISVKDKINVLGLNKEDEGATEEGSVAPNVTSDIKPDNDIKKAGFADILILTVIILIYAAIIINLITKLK